VSYDIFSKNGRILPISEAVASLSSIEYAYGFGVYETLRVKDKAALFASDHIARLLSSARIIGLEHRFSEEKIAVFTQDLISKIESPIYNMKILLIGAPEAEDSSLYIMCSNPLFPDKKLYRDGVKVTTPAFGAFARSNGRALPGRFALTARGFVIGTFRRGGAIDRLVT